MDDERTDSKAVWELMTEYWGLKFPNLVISVTSGQGREESPMALLGNRDLRRKFRDGIMKTAVKNSTFLSNVLQMILTTT